MREYFCAYHDMLDATRRLSDAECGRLFRALLAYSRDGTEPINLQGREEIVFDVYAQQIDREAERYESKCKQMQANASKSKHLLPNRVQDKDKDKDEEEDKEKDKDEEEDKEKDKDSISPPRSRAESEIPDGFDEFWERYPRKVAKQDAVRAWKGLKPSEALRDAILADITKRVGGEWAGEEMRFIPHPTTYLHQRRWEDETTGGRTDGEHRGTAAEEGPRWTLPGEIVL